MVDVGDDSDITNTWVQIENSSRLPVMGLTTTLLWRAGSQADAHFLTPADNPFFGFSITSGRYLPRFLDLEFWKAGSGVAHDV
jgi:hypothetical protein